MRKLIVLILYGIGLAKQSELRRHRHWFRWSLALDKHRTIWKIAEIPACVGLVYVGAKLHSGYVAKESAFEGDIVRQVELYSKGSPTPTPAPTRGPHMGQQVTQRTGHLPGPMLDKAIDSSQ